MNNQNFYLRLIALLLIIMAVFFYNGTVKDKEQAQDIADLTAKTESLEKQQDQILYPLQKLIINSKRILQRIKKIQIRQILKKPMILIMYIRTVLLKVQEPDTVEPSQSR